MHFQIRKSNPTTETEDAQYYWALVAGNNEDLGVSETMHNKSDVISIVRRICDSIAASDGGMRIVDKTEEG